MNLTPDPDGSRAAEFQRAQQLPAWKQWELEMAIDLLRFKTLDVVELSTHRDPLTPAGLRVAELAAHQLFPPDRPRGEVVASRWNRFVGHAFAQLLDGRYINAPTWLDGSDSDRLLPVVQLPTWGGRYVLPLLDAVLAEPEGSPRHGAVLCEALREEHTQFAAWLAAGRPAEQPGGNP